MVIVGRRRNNSSNSSNIIQQITVASFKNKPKRKVYVVKDSTGFYLLEPEVVVATLSYRPIATTTVKSKLQSLPFSERKVRAKT